MTDSREAMPTIIVQQQQSAPAHRSGFPHGLHLLLTLLTGGFWLPIWIVHRLLSSR